MKQATLCILVKDSRILLGFKKVRFGAGRYNGFGGKVGPSETIEQAAARELQEELGVIAKDIRKVGQMDFYFPPENESWNQTVHLYLVKNWEGEPRESEEMRPEWFSLDSIPYNRMWADDKYWLPQVLEGKYVEGKFVFGLNGDSIVNMDLRHRLL